MELNEANLDNFIRSLHKRLRAELEMGVSMELHMEEHYPDERLMKVDGKIFIIPSIGETISIRIGLCPEK